MFVQRFSFFRIFASTTKFGVSTRFAAALTAVSFLSGAFVPSATAQTTALGGAARSFIGRTSAESRRIAPSSPIAKDAASGAPRGIPARIESNDERKNGVRNANRGSVRVDSDQNVANPTNGGANRSVANVLQSGIGDARQTSSNEIAAARSARQTFGAPAPLASVGLQLEIAGFATREEAERAPTPNGTYRAILPRENFLKKNVEEAPLSSTGATGGGIDARVSSGATGETPIRERSVVVSAPLDAEASSGFVAFSLAGLQPDEERLLRDAENGRWDEIDLFEAALIAEGLTTARRRAPYRAKYERLVAELNAKAANAPDPLTKTERVYAFLHENVLTSRYDLNCSSVVAALDRGVFNCVSATTLYNCFAERVGLNVAALETTGHAKSRVKFNDSFLDLETTCSSWARLPDKLRPYSRSVAVARPIRSEAESSVGLDAALAPAAAKTSSETISSAAFDAAFDAASNALADPKRGVANFERETAELGSTVFDPRTFEAEGSAPIGYSHTKNRRPMREIGEVELVATIYYNVGVEFYQKERYEEAIDAYAKAARLAPNNLTILGNLKATLNNWAIQIAMKEKNFERAIQIVEQGMILDPNFEEYRMNLPIFFQHWTTYLAKDDRWEEVARVEKEYLKRFPKPTRR